MVDTTDYVEDNTIWGGERGGYTDKQYTAT